jgi:hypothetical protein
MPAANVTACCSQIPTSKNRPGEEVEAGTLGHRGRHRHDAGILACKLREGLCEHPGKRRRARLLLGHLTGLDRERRGAVPEDRVGFGGLVSLSLARNRMNEYGVIRILVFAQYRNQLRDRVAVDRADVLETELLEQEPRHDELLGHVLGLLGKLEHAFAHLGNRQEEALDVVLQAPVRLPVDDPVQVALQRTDVGRDRHLVVVEDDHQPAAKVSGLV